MLKDVYINSFGAFLPGDPVPNSAMEDYLGLISGTASHNRAVILRQNKIRQRHYALDTQGRALHSNSEMAVHAIKSALQKSEVSESDITYLATSTTIADVMVPGLASHVHAGLGIAPIEIASFQSVCASALMAVKSAYTQIRASEHACAVVSGSEFASRYFRPGFYENTDDYKSTGQVALEADFLRFTLSDGAGAAILQDKPNQHGLSLKIKWIDIRSYADRFDTCMLAGGAVTTHEPTPWGNYGAPDTAMRAGALQLRQDFTMLMRMIPVWVSHYLDLLNRGKFTLDGIDHVCSHYSAHSLREQAVAALTAAGALIPEDKWFTNLYTKGNTGTASIFIILEELFNSDRLKRGQHILCHVPESGRCLNGLMLLEVV